MKLGFEALIEGQLPVDALCESSIRLVLASSVESARERAELLGREEVHSYANENGERVTWAFAGLDEIQEVGADLGDGVEVFSVLYRKGADSEAQ